MHVVPRLAHWAIAPALAVGALTALPLVAGPVAAADLTTCHGKPVTIAATDEAVTGTPEDDVVAVQVTTPRGLMVSTGAGDDTICVYGSVAIILDAGPGDDDVDTTAMTPLIGTLSLHQVSLGDGDDVFTGGVAGEIVKDDAFGTPPTTGADRIDTGGGADLVYTSGGRDSISTGAGNDRVGLEAGRDPQTIDLGEGDDQVGLGLAVTPLTLTGGGGFDALVVSTADISIDTAAQVLTVGATTSAVGSMESYAVEVRGSLTFRGSDGPETLRAVRSFNGEDKSSRTSVLDADMGGGDDTLRVDQAMVGRWAGGEGHDRLETTRSVVVPSKGTKPSIVIDLARGRSTVRGYGRASLTSFADVTVSRYTSVLARGSADDDTISVTACRATVEAGAGRDLVDVDATSCARPSGRLVGGGGADDLSGGKGRDVLVGGAGKDRLVGRAGYDVALGGPGRDTCTAERRVSC